MVGELNQTDRVVAIAVSGPMSVTDLKHYTEDLKDRLKHEAGVSLVKVSGFSERQIRIQIPASILMQYGISMDSIAGKCPRKRAFIVTDDFSQRFAKKIKPFLENEGFVHETWAKCLPEAPAENVKECAEAMKAFEPDLIVALGGGSVMDSAKVAWIMYEKPEITEPWSVSPLDKLDLRKKAIMAAVPTTSGTGSECTPAT